MRMKHLIDENILAALLKGTDEVWQAAFAHYKVPFSAHFEHRHGIGAEKSRELFRESFALVVQGLREGLVKTPLKNTIFTYLVQFGEKQLERAGHLVSSAALPHRPYLAGEVLVILIRRGCGETFRSIVGYYREPIRKTLKKRYSHLNEAPEKIIGEALMAMKGNIETGKVRLPMRATLFTYACHIARNKFLSLNKKMRKGAPLESEEELDKILHRAKVEEEEPGYLDSISDLWPVLSPWLEGNPDECFENLISELDEVSRKILRLRFVEGLKYKEIGQMLGINEGACRKRLSDILHKWRKNFFLRYVINGAQSPVREYLALYLVKRWPFCKIADKYGRPEGEVAGLVADYLRNWRNGNRSQDI